MYFFFPSLLVLPLPWTSLKAMFISKPNLIHMFVFFRFESKMFLVLIYKQEKIFTTKRAKRNFSTFGKYIETTTMQN